jgi:hypothetical protein
LRCGAFGPAVEDAVGAEVFPSGPSAGSHRFAGASGVCFCLVCWAANPVLPRYWSSRPGAMALAARVAAVLAPTQYSRRLGWSAA